MKNIEEAARVDADICRFPTEDEVKTYLKGNTI